MNTNTLVYWPPVQLNNPHSSPALLNQFPVAQSQEQILVS